MSSTTREPTPQRSFSIIMVCGLWAIGLGAGLIYLARPELRPPGFFAGTWPIVALAIGGFCAVGYWMMRRVAVVGYLCLFAINQAILWRTHTWVPQAMLFALIPLFVGIANWREMR